MLVESIDDVFFSILQTEDPRTHYCLAAFKSNAQRRMREVLLSMRERTLTGCCDGFQVGAFS